VGEFSDSLEFFLTVDSRALPAFNWFQVGWAALGATDPFPEHFWNGNGISTT
jgi:hypothetical protein